MKSKAGCLSVIFAAVAFVIICQEAIAAESKGEITMNNTNKSSPVVERSFDIWDWTRPCQDLELFDIWAEDLAQLGFTRVEISAPWRLLEATPGEYDFTFISDRLSICKKYGLGMRLRINSYYSGAVPDWYDGDFWTNSNGDIVGIRIPSIIDERFWSHYSRMCTALTRTFSGEDIFYNAFIGVHAELKWADWWTFDISSLALWRESIQNPRPDWLKKVAGDEVVLPERPEVPPMTQGEPDRNPSARAFIAFREHCWRRAVERFNEAIIEGDPNAKVSAPLGESYRRESAHMSNLDYWGLSRGASQVVHSYDFFWHHQDEPWQAAASVKAFQGITGLPVNFEFDGPSLMDTHGYTVEQLSAIGEQAASVGAGLKFANYSYSDRLPSEHPTIVELMKVWNGFDTPFVSPPREETVLLFVSKWMNYSYRESTEWLHDAQFGIYKSLRDKNIAVRFICEDNLQEDLSEYKSIIYACLQRDVLPEKDLLALEALNLPVDSISINGLNKNEVGISPVSE